MIKNYLKIAWRNLIRQKSFSLINVFGLSIGLACFLILLTFVKFEKSYDSFHPNGEQVFRVVQEVGNESRWAWTGGAVAPMLRKEYEGKLDEVVSIIKISTYAKAPEGLYPEDRFREDKFYFADKGFDKIFQFEMLAGSWEGVFDNPYQIVITEDMAAKYFGMDSPIGKVLTLTGDFDFEVKGVLKNPPLNTHLDFDFVTGIVSFKATENFPANADFGSFWWPQTYTYVKVNENQNPEAISASIPDINPKYRNPEEAKQYVHFLQPISEIHTSPDFIGELTPAMSEKTLWIFLSIGVFVLVLACINYVNLATARAIKRMKEIGIRKVNGAQRSQLIAQFLMESILINAIAMLIGIVLVVLINPLIELNIGLEIPVDFLFERDLQILLFGIWLLSSIVSGIFPAFYLSGLKPKMILKDSSITNGRSVLRKSLVVFQFVLSTILVFCASVAYFQHSFMSNASMGFEPKGMISVKMGELAKANAETISQELTKIPGVKSVKFTSDRPGIDTGWNPPAEYPGMPEGLSRNINVQYVDFGYFETLGIEMASGREFEEESADGGTSYLMRGQFAAMNDVAMIVNESALPWLQKDAAEVIGSPIRVYTEENGQLFSDFKGNVIGVVKDYHTRDLRYSIEPTLFIPVKNSAFDGTQHLIIKADKEVNAQLLEQLETTWKKVVPGLPFDYAFIDESINLQYLQQQKTSSLLGLFAFLTLLISCLGIFGLSLFSSEARKKEIGIRRVLGASVFGIMNKLSSEFLVLVSISLLIALPVGFWLMNDWLDQFAFKVPISVWFFLSSAGISVLLAYVTVSIQSLKSAFANPVESIKSE
ncbi:ABC transporter permease [Algoriphagus sp.]|uniref:ABC transporter permease n=1 Tax=Algoriphagus sp. TaxID=1872435 RepID=UPI0025E194F2|nr:ABC transporter permease [Algoriphagus sp.]